MIGPTDLLHNIKMNFRELQSGDLNRV